MLLKRFFFSTITLATLGFASFGAHAQAPNLIGNFGDWAAYSFEENGSKVCYMVTQPKKAEGNYTKRGDIFALVTHRPGQKTKNVFSYITGYTYKKDSDVTVNIDGQNFKLFTQKDMAWTQSQDDDNRLANAIRKGSKMTVKGTSSRGTLTTDSISLKGSGGAHDAINKACGTK